MTYTFNKEGYNSKQIQVLEYMSEYLSEEDVHVLEAWKMVENYVLDSLEET